MANKSIKSLLILALQGLSLGLVLSGCQLGKDWDGSGNATTSNVNTQGNGTPTVDVKKVCPPGVDCVTLKTDTTDLSTCNSSTTTPSLYGMWTQSRTYPDTHTETTYYTFSTDTTGSMRTLTVSTVCKGTGDPVTATASSKIRVNNQNIVVAQDSEDDTKYTLPNNVAGACKAWTTSEFFTYKMQGTCLLLTSNVFSINPEIFIPAQQ